MCNVLKCVLKLSYLLRHFPLALHKVYQASFKILVITLLLLPLGLPRAFARAPAVAVAAGGGGAALSAIRTVTNRLLKRKQQVTFNDNRHNIHTW